MTNIIEYAVCTYVLCQVFKSYEDAWKYTESYFNETGKVLCIEPVYA